MGEKKRKPPNVTKIQSYVILVLHNSRMAPSNVRKNKGNMEYDKNIVTCDAKPAQYDNGTINCKKKNKGTTECDKGTATIDVGTAEYEDGTIKCEKK